MARFGILRFYGEPNGRSRSITIQPGAWELAKLNAQPNALRTDAEQVCAATDGGSLVPTLGTGNPELDNGARTKGSLRDLPLIVLTGGRYWASRVWRGKRRIVMRSGFISCKRAWYGSPLGDG
jgi:hypothetical protein